MSYLFIYLFIYSLIYCAHQIIHCSYSVFWPYAPCLQKLTVIVLSKIHVFRSAAFQHLVSQWVSCCIICWNGFTKFQWVNDASCWDVVSRAEMSAVFPYRVWQFLSSEQSSYWVFHNGPKVKSVALKKIKLLETHTHILCHDVDLLISLTSEDELKLASWLVFSFVMFGIRSLFSIWTWNLKDRGNPSRSTTEVRRFFFKRNAFQIDFPHLPTSFLYESHSDILKIILSALPCEEILHPTNMGPNMSNWRLGLSVEVEA